jgi:hypothetical protein
MSMDKSHGPDRPEHTDEESETELRPVEPGAIAEQLTPAQIQDYYYKASITESRLESRSANQVARDLSLSAWGAIEVLESHGVDTPEDTIDTPVLL